MTNNTKLNELREFLIKTQIPLATIAKSAKVSRTTIHKINNGDFVKDATVDAIVEALPSLNTTVTTFGKDRSQSMDMLKTQQQTIDSQATTIELQKQIIDDLQTQQTKAWPDDPAKYKLFADVEPHCSSEIVLRNVFSFSKPIERCIINMQGFEKLSKLLGMPYKTFRDVYFSENQWFPNDAHPAEELFSNRSNNDVSTYSKNARQMLRNLKHKFMGYDYLTFYIDYVYKNKIVKTAASIRLEFGLKKVTAEAKTILYDLLD